ncbi:type I restriction enzyme HsdR N-terminal domain-containing protein [Pendulispora brunnea]|uniref:Type I restriction enzyme HsdR N-terminal domain-containing protein n=1 Tax=Pendulispora brunnea TaxID=2905690 RepID=A0ABZ2K2R3_9BACT
MGFFEDLRNFSEQVKRRQSYIKGEEATKQSLVLPLIQLLGYDIYNPTEVQPEYIADFAKKKTNGQFEKVDYAIHLVDTPAIFIEAKAIDVTSSDHDAQLARYFNATPSVKTAILTNGLVYRFYTDLKRENLLDEQPFFVFDIHSFTERDAETLKQFTRESYDGDAVHDGAEELIYVGKLTALVGDLLRNPSENFVRFLLNEIEAVGAGKRLTAKIIERFQPAVRKAIQGTLLEMATRSIKLETEKPELAIVLPLPAVTAPAPTEAAVPESPAEGGKIVTTAEELEAFEIVRELCSDSPLFAKYPPQYKDSQNYFGIHAGSIRYWFCRYFGDQKRKSVVTRLAVDKVKIMSPGFEVDAAPRPLASAAST